MKSSNIAKQATKLVGGVSALARALGRSSSEVSQWASGHRPIPIACCPAIERATGGQVTRRDLRPHDWHLIWPELAENEASNGAISKHALRPDIFGSAGQSSSQEKEAI